MNYNRRLAFTNNVGGKYNQNQVLAKEVNYNRRLSDQGMRERRGIGGFFKALFKGKKGKSGKREYHFNHSGDFILSLFGGDD